MLLLLLKGEAAALNNYTLSADTSTLSVTSSQVAITYGRVWNASAVSYSVSGVAVSALTARPITVVTAALSLTPSTVVVSADRTVTSTASYTLAESLVSLFRAYQLPVTTGAYTLAGQVVALPTGKSLPVTAGSYAITEGSAAFQVDRLLFATGSYTVAGGTATLVKAGQWALEPGVYTLTPSAVAALAGRTVSADTGALTVSTQQVSVTADRLLATVPEAYVETGDFATLTVSRLLTATTSYQLTAAPIDLIQQTPNRILVADTAALVLAPSALSPVAARSLSASSFASSLVAGTANLYKGYAVSATGAYSLVGVEASFDLARLLDTGTSAYTAALQQVDTQVARLVSTTGSYSILPSAVAATAGRLLPVAEVSYAATGYAATLQAHRQLAVELATVSESVDLVVFYYDRHLPITAHQKDISFNPVAVLQQRELQFTAANAYAPGYVSGYVIDVTYKPSKYSTTYVAPGYVGAVGAVATIDRVMAVGPHSIIVSASPVTLTLTEVGVLISKQQARYLAQIAQLHGLLEPLVVSPTARTVGGLVQSVTGTTTVTVTTTTQSEPTFSATMVDELASLYGLLSPLIVTETSRTAGSLVQSIQTVGNTTTVTRQ